MTRTVPKTISVSLDCNCTRFYSSSILLIIILRKRKFLNIHFLLKENYLFKFPIYSFFESIIVLLR